MTKSLSLRITATFAFVVMVIASNGTSAQAWNRTSLSNVSSSTATGFVADDVIKAQVFHDWRRSQGVRVHNWRRSQGQQVHNWRRSQGVRVHNWRRSQQRRQHDRRTSRWF